MSEKKILSVSLVGAPNAGKSTLVNLIVGEKVSGMSPKAHTTREQVRGVVNKDQVQLVFLDNPGFIANSTEIAFDADCICVVLDATNPWKYDLKNKIQLLLKQEVFFTILINKGDLIGKERWVELIDEIKDMGYDQIIWITSALYNKGVERFLNFLCENALPGQWWFDKKHNLSRKEIILECVREKIFHLTHKEVPYSIELEMRKLSFQKGKPWSADVVLKTIREGQKNILIGKKASVIKSIGQAARMELCSRFGPGSLFLKVL